MATLEVEVDLEVLAIELARECNHVALLKFIMDIDEQVCERSFTEELVERLNNILIEDES